MVSPAAARQLEFSRDSSIQVLPTNCRTRSDSAPPVDLAGGPLADSRKVQGARGLGLRLGKRDAPGHDLGKLVRVQRTLSCIGVTVRTEGPRTRRVVFVRGAARLH